MKFPVRFVFLITIYIIPTAYSQSPRPVPGCSGCVYFGSTKEMCHAPVIPVTALPKECSSLLFYELKSDDQFVISDGTKISGNSEYIHAMLCSGKPSFLFYRHTSYDEWMKVLSCNTQDGGVNAKIEMKNLKAYLEQYENLSGIVLKQLTKRPGSSNLPDVTGNLKIYLEEMRTTFPDYGIGLELIGRDFIEFYKKGNISEWLDFSVLNPYFDFYIFNVYSFNFCTKKLKIGGTTPVSGHTRHTLEKLANYIEKSCIPKEKTYFLFRSGPSTSNPNIKICKLTNSEICARPNLDHLCADNTKSFNDKGTFAQQKGAGFITMDVDLSDDPLNLCGCESPYPAFYNILAGFISAPTTEN